MDERALQEIRADVKEIKSGLDRFQLDVTDIKARMPSMSQVQKLEIELNTLKTQFKVVWVVLGAIGTMVTAIVITGLMNLIVVS